MADWDRDTDRERDVLLCIVALLVSLADLADIAAGLPWPRRREVLAILMWSQAEGHALIAGMAPGAPAFADERPKCSDAPGPASDAALLAATFRVLALALYTMLREADRAAAPGASAPVPGTQAARAETFLRAFEAAALPANDTS